MVRKTIPASLEDQSTSFSMPSPIGGWNARDNIAMMKPTDAYSLDNWFPGTTEVTVRQGYVPAATVPAGEVIRSLFGVANQNGTFKRFAVTAAGIYDITAGGAIAVAANAVSNNDWQYVQINVGGVSYLWCCCGDTVNKVRLYNATTNAWLAMDGASVPALTGPTSANVTNVSLWKFRLFLCMRQSMVLYYSPLNSVGGAFTALPLGGLFTKGGFITATTSWTVDAGDGPDDRFVVMTSEGEIAIFQGIDPATDFSLVGVYNVGKPLSRRCFVRLAGDVGVLTEQGLWPLSRALQSATVDQKPALTNKIQSAFNHYYRTYGVLFGWEAQLLPKGPALVVNVPIGSAGSYQFVMNTITGSWCRFTNWNAEAMLVVDGKLYLAAGNGVVEAWTGRQDGVGAIQATGAMAFTYGNNKQRIKQVKLVQPLMRATASGQVSLALDSDFSPQTAIANTATIIGPDVGIWDLSLWGDALWGGAPVTIGSWRQVNHKPGKSFSLRCRVFIKGMDLSWSANDFIAETGALR